MNQQTIPTKIEQILNKRIPELSIEQGTYFDGSQGWGWTFRCAESDSSFESWEEALIDFAAITQYAMDEKLGLDDDDDNDETEETVMIAGLDFELAQATLDAP